VTFLRVSSENATTGDSHGVPRRRKIDRSRACAYCRYGPVSPSKRSCDRGRDVVVMTIGGEVGVLDRRARDLDGQLRPSRIVEIAVALCSAASARSIASPRSEASLTVSPLRDLNILRSGPSTLPKVTCSQRTRSGSHPPFERRRRPSRSAGPGVRPRRRASRQRGDCRRGHAPRRGHSRRSRNPRRSFERSVVAPRRRGW